MTLLSFLLVYWVIRLPYLSCSLAVEIQTSQRSILKRSLDFRLAGLNAQASIHQ